MVCVCVCVCVAVCVCGCVCGCGCVAVWQILVVMEILFMSLWVFRVRALMALIPAAATRKWVFRVGIVGCVAFAVMPLTVVLGGFVVDYARKRAVR